MGIRVCFFRLRSPHVNTPAPSARHVRHVHANTHGGLQRRMWRPAARHNQELHKSERKSGFLLTSPTRAKQTYPSGLS